MNNCNFFIRLTKEPTFKEIIGKDGKQILIADMYAAIPRKGKFKEDEQSADFASFTAYGPQAKYVKLTGKKGTPYVIVSRYESSEFIDKTGKKVYRNGFVIKEMDVVNTSAKTENDEVKTNQQPDLFNLMDSMAGFSNFSNAEPQTQQKNQMEENGFKAVDSSDFAAIPFFNN